MRIGILTFYKVANFGANLQGVSTYYYLKNHGHCPVFIDYQSEFTEKEWQKKSETPQGRAHKEFVNKFISTQTPLCHNEMEMERVVRDFQLDGVIIGSDAVLQHHPFITRIERGQRKPFRLSRPRPESIFPNMFWGGSLAERIPFAMMSVSSQGSLYKFFTSKTKRQMSDALLKMKYISVRDTWTQDMIRDVNSSIVTSITPDPVFAFNGNLKDIIPSKNEILEKFHLPERYILVSLFSQSVTIDRLVALKDMLMTKGYSCVALPMPHGYSFEHPFSLSIPIPLSPLDWYALIKHSSGYVGSNMHPIVVALHNTVPCFSLDNWGNSCLFNFGRNDSSSKIYHILGTYDLLDYRVEIKNGKCNFDVENIVEKILNFPYDKVRQISTQKYNEYCSMMDSIMDSLIEKQ